MAPVTPGRRAPLRSELGACGFPARNASSTVKRFPALPCGPNVYHTCIVVIAHIFWVKPTMIEIEQLIILRGRLIARRRSLVASLQNAAPEQLSGESIAQIQSALDAVNRAIEEQMDRAPKRGV
jgi:hypothetical protein